MVKNRKNLLIVAGLITIITLVTLGTIYFLQHIDAPTRYRTPDTQRPPISADQKSEQRKEVIKLQEEAERLAADGNYSETLKLLRESLEIYSRLDDSASRESVEQKIKSIEKKQADKDVTPPSVETLAPSSSI